MHVNIFILIIFNVLYIITHIFFINEGSSWYGGRVNPSDRYKVQLALKFLKTRLTEFRSEERRKVQLYIPLTMNEGSLLYYNYINFPGTGSCTI